MSSCLPLLREPRIPRLFRFEFYLISTCFLPHVFVPSSSTWNSHPRLLRFLIFFNHQLAFFRPPFWLFLLREARIPRLFAFWSLWNYQLALSFDGLREILEGGGGGSCPHRPLLDPPLVCVQISLYANQVPPGYFYCIVHYFFNIIVSGLNLLLFASLESAFCL